MGWGQAFDPARLWPVRIVAGTTAVTANTTTASGAVLFGLDYDNYEANGNIAAVTRKLRLVANRTQYTLDFGYSYDRLNRLAGCAVADTVYTYAMDEFGNITALTWAAGGGGQMPNSKAMAVSPLTNQLSGAGYAYDVLGNLVQMPAGVDFVTMSYLDQGHIGTLTDASGVVWKYYYDADGKRRIKVKTAGGAATEPDGQGGVRLVADRSYYFYEGEDLICQQDVGALVQDESQYEPKFLLLDHLGSTRAELVFDPSTLAPQIQEYYDLMPYGEVIDPPTSQESVLFTGKQRDYESNLDQFGARAFSSVLSRWVSPDQPFIDDSIKQPHSWNLYRYCSLNPVVNYDPNGFKDRPFDGNKDKPITVVTGTATPRLISDPKNGKKVINTDAYNCHSFAWHDSLGDPTDPRNAIPVRLGATKWDNNPDDDLGEFIQLKPEENNELLDRMIKYVDVNGDGIFQIGEEAVHSALVQAVDKEGYTTSVVSKLGDREISENHPNAPDFYNTNNKGASTKNAYFRKIDKVKETEQKQETK